MKINISIFFSFLFLQTIAQQRSFSQDGIELFKLEYSLFPSLDNTHLEKKSISFNMGKKLKTSMLAFGLNYSKYDISFNGYSYKNNLVSFEDIHNIRFNIIYRKPLKNNWSFNAVLSPLLSSNFKEKISNNDFFFNAFLSTSKNWFKNDLKSTLTFGLGFGTLLGNPTFFPVFSYRKELSLSTSYNIGLPVTGFFHKLNKKNAINFTLSPEGLFANNSKNILDKQNNEVSNTRLQFNGLKLALGYQSKFDKNWIVHFNLGYMPLSNMEIIDINNNTLYNVNTNNYIFINTAISFNLNKKK